MVPPAVVHAQANCLDDVRVVQAFRDAVLGLDLLLVLLLRLCVRLATELLHCIQLAWEALSGHDPDLGCRPLPEAVSVPTEELVLIFKFMGQVTNVDHKIVWQTQAQSTSLDSYTSFGGLVEDVAGEGVRYLGVVVVLQIGASVAIEARGTRPLGHLVLADEREVHSSVPEGEAS